MAKYSSEELKTIIDAELKAALGASGTEIAKVRARNLQYYRALPEGELAAPEVADRSDIVSTDVADSVEWMLPSLMRVFCSPDSLQVNPTKPDYQGHKLVKAYLNHVFWKKARGFEFLYSFIKDGLVQKVGFGKVWWERYKEDAEESYVNLTPAQLAMVAADDSVEIVEQQTTETIIEGQPIQTFSVRLKKTYEKGKVCLDSVAPEEMRISPKAKYGEPPHFIAQEFYMPRNELEADGYDLTNVSTGEEWTEEETERQSYLNQSYWDDSTDETTRYKCCEAYIKLDQDEDGIPEWRRVFIIGDQIFDDEKVDDHPFVFFCPSPSPHQFFGDCPADWAREPQRFRTHLMRALEDNILLSVNQRTGVVEGQVNLDDLTNSRPGGVVRMKSPTAIVPIPTGSLPSDAWQMVEWGEQWVEKRTGFSRMSKGLSSEALNDTATGVLEITERADMRTELIARHAAESMRQVFLKILKNLSMYQNIAEAIEVNGQWVDVDPREWHKQYEISIKAGLGTANKDRETGQRQALFATQMQLAQMGMVPPPSLVVGARKLAEALGEERPEILFPDPPPPQPPQPPPEVVIEQMKSQARMQEAQAKTQADVQKFQAEQQIAAQSKSQDQQFELQKLGLDLASKERIEAAKLEASARDKLLELSAGIIAAQENAKAQNLINGTQLDQSAQSVDSSEQLIAVMQQVQQLAQTIAAPKQILRDEAGNIIGVQRVM